MSASVKERTGGVHAGGSHRVRTIILVLLLGALVGFVYLGSNSGGTVLAHSLSEPLNGATSATVVVDPGDGNLTIDPLAGGEGLLASGTLQYLDNRGVPKMSANVSNGQASLSLSAAGGGQPWFQFPWAACNGATDWQVRLNPSVPSDLTAHTDGGNIKVNLTGMGVSRLLAETGGGNVDVVLPGKASDLTVKASTGGGNVTVLVPSGVAAKIHATSGLGKVTVDSRFVKLDGNTYQSPDYESATNRVEVTAGTGAGNVSVETK